MKTQKLLCPLGAIFVAVSCFSMDATAAEAAGVITPNSAGAIELGMTLEDARAAMKGAEFGSTSDGEGISLISVSMDGKVQMYLYAGEEETGGVIDFIQVMGSDLKTVTGAHVGMKVADAEPLYGKVTEAFVSEIEARQYVTFADQPSGLSFRMENNSGTIGGYDDREQAAGNISPGATIHSIEISGANIMSDAAIGGISLRMAEADLLAIAAKEGLGEPEKGEDMMLDAIGEAVQTWDFKDAGLSVEMSSAKVGGDKEVFAITLRAPSKLKTGQGIGIGSAKADAVKAYADYKTEQEEANSLGDSGDKHLVGSIYGGMIFSFEKGKVSEIFLGAAAE
ncbi:MAG: hypothetical protein ABJQ29_05450 [Luteolibacter sp.]